MKIIDGVCIIHRFQKLNHPKVIVIDWSLFTLEIGFSTNVYVKKIIQAGFNAHSNEKGVHFPKRHNTFSRYSFSFVKALLEVVRILGNVSRSPYDVSSSLISNLRIAITLVCWILPFSCEQFTMQNNIGKKHRQNMVVISTYCSSTILDSRFF